MHKDTKTSIKFPIRPLKIKNKIDSDHQIPVNNDLFTYMQF